MAQFGGGGTAGVYSARKPWTASHVSNSTKITLDRVRARSSVVVAPRAMKFSRWSSK